jgi:adenylate cyclase
MRDGRLARLLDRVLAEPGCEAAVAETLDQLFGIDAAILVIDMAGFSRLTCERGIVAALLAIRQLQVIGLDEIESHGGELVKTDADNLYAVFPDAAAAYLCAQVIAARIPAAAGIGYGRILLLEGDLFGEEVNRASKLGEDTAGAGEILLTEAAAAQLVHT